MRFIKENEVAIVEEQWRALNITDWRNEQIPENILEFWPLVFKYKRVDQVQPFRELALAVISLLILPISNAAVERVFSLLTSAKTKFLNNMLLQMLAALLRIKMHLNVYKMCYVDFKPCKEMIKFDSSI